MTQNHDNPQGGAPGSVDSLATAPRPRRSYARWRALSLSLVYVVFAAHFIHWKIKGETLAPLELNEVMYTLELGIVTAAFFFMCFLVLGTLIFGRFFCSWACHIMVLQDLCAWMLRKLRISVKPIRSRVLLFVPPLTAAYMFLWPQIVRAWENRAFPTFHLRSDAEGWASFTTDHFWRNLPTPWIVVLTFLVCGFAIVYLLGSRTFCTYVCPYGAIFALADRFSPGKIRVNDKCQQCGTCTAACTSGVRVHEEVKRHGMIVNPACLKDLDCVAACPQNALHYKFSKPALFKSYRGGGRFGLPYDFSLLEELLIAAVFVVVLLSFRSLYSRVPFLLSLAMGAITGYFAVLAVRLFTKPSVALSTIRLKEQGRLTTSGGGFAVFFLVLTAFVAHSAFVRYHEYSGLRQARALRASEVGEDADALAASAASHLAAANRWGLFRNVRVQRGMLLTAMRLARFENAEVLARDLLERHPDDSWIRLQLAQSLAAQDRLVEAERLLRTIITPWQDEIEGIPAEIAAAHRLLGQLLGRRGDFPSAAYELANSLALDPDQPAVHAQLGSLLAELGRFEEAVARLREALRLDPDLSEAHYNLGTLLAHQGQWAQAITCYEKALVETPDDPELHNNLGFALLQTGELEQSYEELTRAVTLDPHSADAHFNLARVLAAKEQPDEASDHLRTAARLDPRYAKVLDRRQ